MSDLTIQLAVFLVLSALLLLFTLKRRHRHRFYRFGAFECVLALVQLSTGSWFVSPFSGLQLLSWLLLAGSFGLALHAVLLRFALLVAFAFRTAQVEEGHNLERFGQAYRDYQLRTKMFIPFLV